MTFNKSHVISENGKFSIEKVLKNGEKSKNKVRFKPRVVEELKEKTMLLEHSESAEEN